MKPKSKRITLIVASALLMTSCASNSTKEAAPEIISVTKISGKGTPWGQSDSGVEFIVLGQSSIDPTYGFDQNNPIRVGGLSERREAAYLNGLRSPAGEPIEYERMGSCCPFKTPKRNDRRHRSS